MRYPILICTVGTSLLRPNLEGLKGQLEKGTLPSQRRRLAEAYAQGDWSGVAQELAALPESDRLCGAEINSIASMIEKGYVEPQCGLYFLYSQTEQGRRVADVLQRYYRRRGHQPVEALEVADLQDEDPKRFRRKGLRQLARDVAKVVRRHSPAACAINATGGYKAQIAVGVVLGQALGVPVYYKHELFSEVIAFPPLPVALDFELWMRASGMLGDLASSSDEPAPAARYEEEWDERYESLVERVRIDGVEYVELSPTGQIFYETFRDRFRSAADWILPPPAASKETPRLEGAGWPGKHPEVERFMRRVTDAIPFVVKCETKYYNPALPERNRFVLSGGEVVAVYSDGRYCAKFVVRTTAQTPGQRAATVAALNEWLADPDYFRSREQIAAEQATKERDEALAAWQKTESRLAEFQACSDRLGNENAQLREENDQLRRRTEQLSAEAAGLLEQLEESRRQLVDLRAELDAQLSASGAHCRTAENLAGQLRAAQRELAEARMPWWRRWLRR